MSGFERGASEFKGINFIFNTQDPCQDINEGLSFNKKLTRKGYSQLSTLITVPTTLHMWYTCLNLSSRYPQKNTWTTTASQTKLWSPLDVVQILG